MELKNPKNHREAVLLDAAEIVSGEREDTYGGPEDSFARIAAYWSTCLNHEVTPLDVAKMMLLLKVARLDVAPDHRDSWVDVAGYAACGAEVAFKQTSYRKE